MVLFQCVRAPQYWLTTGAGGLGQWIAAAPSLLVIAAYKLV